MLGINLYRSIRQASKAKKKSKATGSSWSEPLEGNLKCQRCGCTEASAKYQRFKDGSEHVRLDCKECGRYIKYRHK